jgi:anti-sigma regulatory factor (Ser/Thr protein kinase)
MDVTDARLIVVTEQSQVSEARRVVTALGAEQGLDQKAIDRAALVTTELATNLVKHAHNGGCLIAQGLSEGENVGVEIFSVDKGPGMNKDECMLDGFSSTGTLGTGLGAIARISNSIDIESHPNGGTVIQARLWLNQTDKAGANSTGGLTVPIHGEQLSGDKWLACEVGQSLYCLVVDGLGHGFEAAEAARLACERFKKNLTVNPASMLKIMHDSLRGSRGAVAAAAKIDFAQNKLTYAGLGNITGLLFDGDQCKHLVSLNGTLGYEFRKATEFEFPWSSQSTLVMHSDGISSKVSENRGKGMSASAGIAAASLYFNYAKKNDDATVLVARGSR